MWMFHTMSSKVVDKRMNEHLRTETFASSERSEYLTDCLWTQLAPKSIQMETQINSPGCLHILSPDILSPASVD